LTPLIDAGPVVALADADEPQRRAPSPRRAAERSPQEAATLADEFYGRGREEVAKQPAKARCNWRLVLLRLAKRS
jgi:hypothetical protein